MEVVWDALTLEEAVEAYAYFAPDSGAVESLRPISKAQVLALCHRRRRVQQSYPPVAQLLAKGFLERKWHDLAIPPAQRLVAAVRQAWSFYMDDETRDGHYGSVAEKFQARMRAMKRFDSLSVAEKGPYVELYKADLRRQERAYLGQLDAIRALQQQQRGEKPFAAAGGEVAQAVQPAQ